MCDIMGVIITHKENKEENASRGKKKMKNRRKSEYEIMKGTACLPPPTCYCQLVKFFHGGHSVDLKEIGGDIVR